MTAPVAVQTPPTPSILRPALLVMSGRSLAFVATFFIPVVLVRLFDPVQFGTYKQLFLVHSTVFLIAQFGIASSLYYFLPRTTHNTGRYVANALACLAIAGLGGLALLVGAATNIADWLNNPSLVQYLPWIGLYLLLTMLAAPLEIVLLSLGKYLWASVSYALFDLIRAGAFVLPVLLFRQLDALLHGAVVLAGVRAMAAVIYFRREFRNGFRLDRVLLRSQLAYALPFGTAVLFEILQASLPQYAVSYWTDPGTFAVFVVGCLQIPLVDFAASPASDVMMVKMQEELASGSTRSVLAIWYETTYKLALLLFPLTAFLIACAPEVIVVLFTETYAASVPIFTVWSAAIVFAALQVDGVLRVFAQTKLILILNLMRLAILAALLQFSMTHFALVGPVLVTLLATAAFKAGALMRIKSLLGIGIAELLPWRNLGRLFGASAASALAVLAVKSQLQLPVIVTLVAAAVVYFTTYVLLVWYLSLLSESEKSAIVGWCRKTIRGVGQLFDGKGG